MNQALFLRNKIKRQILMNGKECTFTTYKLDKYKSLVVDSEIIVQGIYHEQASHVIKTTSDATIKRKSKIPMLLVLKDECTDNLKINDSITVNGVVYRVADITNLMDLNVAYDISMEVIDNGGST